MASKFSSKLKKARWLGIAPNYGDALTYHINTENEQGRNRILVRSVIKTRRKNIGTDKESINEDSELSDFYIDESFRDKDQDPNEKKEIETMELEELNNDNNQVEYHDDQEENIITPEEASNLEDITTIYDEFDSRDKELDQMEFNSILDHKFKDGILIFNTRYVGDIDEAIV